MYIVQDYGGVIGKTYFNAKNINNRLKELVTPKIRGYFLYEIKNEKIISYKWKSDPDGFITIYEQPKQRNPYVLGGDTAR